MKELYSYAKALFELASDDEQKAAWLRFLEQLEKIVNDEFFSVALGSPKISTDIKQKMLEQSFGRVLAPFEQTFVRLLFKNQKVKRASELRRAYEQLLAEHASVCLAFVQTPISLAADQIVSLQTALEKKLNRKIIIQQNLDRSIRGLRIKVGTYLYEHTLQTIIKQLILNIIRG